MSPRRNSPIPVFCQVAAFILCGFFFYGILYFATAEQKFNTLLGSGYSGFEYSKIPEYGTPVFLRKLGYEHFRIDLEGVVDSIFRPAFELDRRFLRKRYWATLDDRYVVLKPTAPNKPAIVSPIPPRVD